MALDARISALVTKLHHDMVEVRERAISSLFSKVVVSGLVAIESFPPTELASALVHALSCSSGSEDSSTQQLLRLASGLARASPSGAAALCQCGALRSLEGMAELSTGTSGLAPQEVVKLLLSLAPGISSTRGNDGHLPSAQQPVIPSRSVLSNASKASSAVDLSGALSTPRTPSTASVGLVPSRLSSRILSSSRSSPSSVARNHGNSAAPSPMHLSPPRALQSPAPSLPFSSPVSGTSGRASLPATSLSQTATEARRTQQSPGNASIRQPISNPKTQSPPSVAAAQSARHQDETALLFNQYHSGWRPASVGLDAPDLKRLSDIEAVLCQRGRSDHQKAKACHALSAFLADCPGEVLLERPAAIHALLATARAPAAEAAARACTAAASWSGGSSSATRDPAGRRPALLFQRLLDASLSALSAVATSLDKIAQRHGDASVMGGDATAASARTARAAVRAEQSKIEEEDNREWNSTSRSVNSDSSSGYGGGGAYSASNLWSPVLNRYPCPLVQHASFHHPDSDEKSSVTATTPLSIGGAALLLLRSALPMAFPTCANLPGGGGVSGESNQAVVVVDGDIAERVLFICHTLLPLLKEPLNTNPEPGGSTQSNRAAAEHASSRQITIVRVQAALELVLAPLVASSTSSSSSSSCQSNGVSLADLEAQRGGVGRDLTNPGAAPLVFVLLRLFSSVIPVDWVAPLAPTRGAHPAASPPSWCVQFADIPGGFQVVEELACSRASLERAGIPPFASSVVDAIAERLNPQRYSKGIASARHLLASAKSLAQHVTATAVMPQSSLVPPSTDATAPAGQSGNVGVWVEQWVSSLAAATRFVLPHIDDEGRGVQGEAVNPGWQNQQPPLALAICRGSVFMWALCVAPAALLSSNEECFIDGGGKGAEAFETALSSLRPAAEALMLSLASESDNTSSSRDNRGSGAGAPSCSAVSANVMDALADFLAPSPPTYVHDAFPFCPEASSRASGTKRSNAPSTGATSFLTATAPALSAVHELSSVAPHLRLRTSISDWEVVSRSLVFNGLLLSNSAGGSGRSDDGLGTAVLARIASALTSSYFIGAAKSARRLLGVLARHITLECSGTNPLGGATLGAGLSSSSLVHLCLRLGQQQQQRQSQSQQRQERHGDESVEEQSEGLRHLSDVCTEALAVIFSPSTLDRRPLLESGGDVEHGTCLFELRRCFDVNPTERLAGAEWLALAPTSPLNAPLAGYSNTSNSSLNGSESSSSRGRLASRCSCLFNEPLDRAQDFIGTLCSYTTDTDSTDDESSGLASTFSLAGRGGIGGGTNLSFGSGDVSQLSSLAIDADLGLSTRAAAMHQLAHVLAAALLSSPAGSGTSDDAGTHSPQRRAARVGLGGPSAVAALLDAALHAASPFAASNNSNSSGGSGGNSSCSAASTTLIDDVSEASEAALSLVLVLTWSLPGLVRPRLLASLCDNSTIGEMSTDESNPNGEGVDGGGSVLVAWLFASAAPAPSLRRAANTSALILWRLLFDPKDLGTALGSSNDHKNESVVQAEAVVSPRACYPGPLLLQFPPPPLAPLRRLSDNGIGGEQSAPGGGSFLGPTSVLPGLLERVEAVDWAPAPPLKVSLRLPSYDSITAACPAASAFFVSELRLALNLPPVVSRHGGGFGAALDEKDKAAVEAGGTESSDKVAAWFGGHAAASALLRTMAEAKSHAELTGALIAANTWVFASSECLLTLGSRGPTSHGGFVHSFVGAESKHADSSGKGNARGEAGGNDLVPGGAAAYLIGACGGATGGGVGAGRERKKCATWEEALAPLLKSTPTAPRDLRLLLKAMPLLKAVARVLSPMALAKLVKTVVNVMVPVLLLDTDASVGNEQDAVFFPTNAASGASDVSFGSELGSAVERAAASSIWMPSPSSSSSRANDSCMGNSGVDRNRSHESSSGEGNGGAGASRSTARAVMELQGEVLALLHTILSADEGSSQREGGGKVCLVLCQNPSLMSALVALLRRRSPASFLLTTASVGVLASGGGQSASIGAEVPCAALAFVGALARTTARAVAASAAAESEDADTSAVLAVGSVWGRCIPDLVGASDALLSIPRLPDTFIHKAVLKRALDATRGLLHLSSVLKAVVTAGGGLDSSDTDQRSGVLEGGLPQSVGANVLQWVRRLSVDREATVRAGALGLLGEAFKLGLFSTQQQQAPLKGENGGSSGGGGSGTDAGFEVGAWMMTEALRACVRAASDPSEAPVVRSEALNAVADALQQQQLKLLCLDRTQENRGGVGHGDVNDGDDDATLQELQRTCLACVSALGAAHEDGSAVTPCFVASAARFVTAAASVAAASSTQSNNRTGGSSLATFGVAIVPAVFRSGVVASLAAWTDPFVLTKLHHTALAQGTTLMLPLPLDDDCGGGAGGGGGGRGGLPDPDLNSGLGGGTLHRGSFDSTALAAAAAIRALRFSIAAADVVPSSSPASAGGVAAGLRHSLLRSTHILSVVLRLVCSADNVEDDGDPSNQSRSGGVKQESEALWIEAALFLVDILEGEGSATPNLLNHNSSTPVPGALALALAAILKKCTHDRRSNVDQRGCATAAAAAAVAVAAKLAVSVLHALGWGSCISRNPHASVALWQALTLARREYCPLALHAVVSPPTNPSSISAWSPASTELSLHLHCALGLLVDLRPDLGLVDDSIGTSERHLQGGNETTAGDVDEECDSNVSGSAEETMVEELSSEVDAIHHFYLEGYSSSTLTVAAREAATVRLGLLCQHRLACLRSLAALSDDTVGVACVSRLGVFTDRVWSTVAAISQSLKDAAATYAFPGHAAIATLPLCMDLLVETVTNAAVAGSDEARRALCSPPSWIAPTSTTTTARTGSAASHGGKGFTSSSASVVSTSSSTTHQTNYPHHASSSQPSVVARRLIKLAMSSAASAASASSLRSDDNAALSLVGSSPAVAVARAMVAVGSLCSVNEGRSLLLQHSAPARFVQILRESLGSNGPPRLKMGRGVGSSGAAAGAGPTGGARTAAAMRTVSILRLLVAASVHREFAAALLQAPGFGDWLEGQVECFVRQDGKTKGLGLTTAESVPTHNTSSAFVASTRSAFVANAQPKTTRSAHRAARREPLSDPLASSALRELVALLVRNLAIHRGNKGTLVATTGVLSFLLSAVDSAVVQSNDLVASAAGEHHLRVCAAASAALWSLCHHSERAVGALRALRAAAPVAHCLERLQRGGGGEALVFLRLPSVERAMRHLSMLQLLLAR